MNVRTPHNTDIAADLHRGTRIQQSLGGNSPTAGSMLAVKFIIGSEQRQNRLKKRMFVTVLRPP
jgi:hypothetical protein